MKIIYKLLFLAMLAGTARPVCGQGFSLEYLESGPSTSIRGLSVLNDSVAWLSGTDGWVGWTTDRGLTWQWRQVTSHEAKDFRDIEAFSADEAVLLCAGSPLVILHTQDGGDSWEQVYQVSRKEIFFDGMDFWDDRRGIAYGDPIGGVMQLLITDDGGRSWEDISARAGVRWEEGEAGFAASGTGIRVLPGGHVFIASGGLRSQLYHSTDYGLTWEQHDCPILQGESSTGIFSIAFRDPLNGLAVGGDYGRDTLRNDVIFLTSDGGKSWNQPRRGTNGYRSAVEYVTPRKLIATGTSGTDYSTDGGITWELLSNDGFHAVRKAKKGSWVLLAGANGRIAAMHQMTP